MVSLVRLPCWEYQPQYILCVPLRYCKSGEYCFMYKVHFMTVFVLKVLQVRFSRSIWTYVLWPQRIFRNSFSVCTIERNSLFVVVYLVCAWFNVLNIVQLVIHPLKCMLLVGSHLHQCEFRISFVISEISLRFLWPWALSCCQGFPGLLLYIQPSFFRSRWE